MSTSSALLAKASKYAFKRLKAVGGNPSSLPIALQTIVVIYSAQGVIDNGGLRYFFELTWPHDPDYSFFSAAYRRIGAKDAADTIDKAVASFPFKEPHLHHKKRNAFLDSRSKRHLLHSSVICGDDTIWDLLEKYVLTNRKEFKIA